MIVLVGIGAYANSFDGVFVLDEQTAIVDNPNIRSLRTSFSAPPEVGFAGRPVVSFSFAVNYALAPRDVRDAFSAPAGNHVAAAAVRRNLWGYHAVNLVIHVMAALALFGVLRRSLLAVGPASVPAHARGEAEASTHTGSRGEAETSPHTYRMSCATAVSLVIALLWVAHPLATSSITYVAQRVESLMGLFFLLTVYCAIRAGELAVGPASVPADTPASACHAEARSDTLNERRRVPANGLLWTIASVAFCLLGVGTKEVMVAAPIFVVLYDWVFFAQVGPALRPSATAQGVVSEVEPRAGRPPDASERRPYPLFSARLPLYAGYVGCVIVLAYLVVTNPRSASVGASQGWTSWLYLQTQGEVIVHYLRLAIVPWPLVLDYEWPAASSLAGVLPELVFLLVLFALTAWGLVRRKPIALLGAWFFLILAPSSSVLPIVTEIAAEHRMYLPLAAVIALVVIVVARSFRFAERVARSFRFAERVARSFRFAERVARRPSGVAPTFASAGLFMVVALAIASSAYLTAARNGDYSRYERIWADTVAKRPANARARSNYGTALFQQGRLPEAEAQLREAVRIREAYPEAHANLGAVLCTQGQLDEGIRHLQRAIALEPDYRDAYGNLGEALATLGRNAEALAAYRKALVSAPNDPRLLSRVAWLMATAPEDNVRDGRSALRLAERAVQITDGRDADSLDTLAAAYAELDRFNDAVSTQQRALAVAESSGVAGMLGDMQVRLEMYRARQKFRQVPLQRG